MNPHLSKCHHQNSKSPYHWRDVTFRFGFVFTVLLWMLGNAIEYLISTLRLKLSSLSNVKISREKFSSLKTTSCKRKT